MTDRPRRLEQLVEHLEGAGWRTRVADVSEQPYPMPWLYAACTATKDDVSLSASWTKEVSPGAHWHVRLLSVSVGRDDETRFVRLVRPRDLERVANWSTSDIVEWLDAIVENRPPDRRDERKDRASGPAPI